MKLNIKTLFLTAVFAVFLSAAAHAGVVLQADLFVMPVWAPAGGTVTIQMWVTNTGDATATNVFPSGPPVQAWPTAPGFVYTGFTGPQPSSPVLLTPSASTGFIWTYNAVSSGGTSPPYVFTCSAQGVQLTPPATIYSNEAASAPIPTETPTFTNTVFQTPTITLTATEVLTPADTPTPSFPDLIITGVSNITMDDPVPGCVPPGGPYPPLGIHVYYQNTGTGNAGSFRVAVDGITQTAAALLAGQTADVFVPGGFSAGSVTAVIDYYNAVTESNESNNTFVQVVAIPTLPVDCSPTDSPTSMPSPTFTLTAALISSPTTVQTPTSTSTAVNTPTCACTGGISPTITLTATLMASPTNMQTATSTRTATQIPTTGTTYTITPTATSWMPAASPTFTATAGTPVPSADTASIKASSIISPLKGEKASFSYEVGRAAMVKIIVYDRNGRLIRTLQSGYKEAGIYNEDWDGTFSDGKTVSAGVYVIYVKIGNYEKKLKVAVKK